MKNAFWTYWLILLGVFIVVIMLLVQSVTTNNQQDYFLVKELTEAAMVDAVDFAYYRQYGEIKMNKEKFYESFIRRFAENASLTTTYTINFYDVYEAPPKASVEVKGKSGSFTVVGESTDFDIVNRIDAILEGNVLSPNVKDYYTSDEGDTTTPSTGGSTQPGTTNPGSSTGTTTPEDNPTTNPESGELTANKLTTKEKDENSVTVEVVVTPGSGKVTQYYFSKDNGATWEQSSSNVHTFTGLNPNTKYNFKAYAKDDANNTSNVTTLTEATNGEGNVTQTCLLDEDYITSRNLSGMHGTSMASQQIYKVFKEYQTIGTTSAGTKFTILGERMGANNIEWWAIEYPDNKCGWIDSRYAAIYLRDYVPEVSYNITNSSSSIFKSSGVSIPGVTGNKLYSNSFEPIATYSFAKLLKKAAANAAAGGDSLVVYDAYRPRGVTTYIYNKLYSLYGTNSTVRNGINSFGDISWFLSKGPSAHNTGCAVDITLSGGSMPSAMHELSTQAAVYKTAGSSSYSNGYKNSTAAQKLRSYMTNAGMTTLKSEWWHFEDLTCHKRIKGVTSQAGAYFWSNV